MQSVETQGSHSGANSANNAKLPFRCSTPPGLTACLSRNAPVALRFVSKPWISHAPYKMRIIQYSLIRSPLLRPDFGFSVLSGVLIMTPSHVSYVGKIIHFSTGPEYMVVFLISIIKYSAYQERKRKKRKPVMVNLNLPYPSLLLPSSFFREASTPLDKFISTETP